MSGELDDPWRIRIRCKKNPSNITSTSSAKLTPLDVIGNFSGVLPMGLPVTPELLVPISLGMTS
jgi:hypothetical protein